jgi:hypothetical protein
VLGLITYALARTLGEWAVAAFNLVVNLALSASMMVLATTSSLRSALNPALVFGLMFRIDWPYLVLIAFLTLLAGSTWALVAFLAERVEPQTLLVITGLSFMYFTVIMFHLMGYVVYQYHERLGLLPSQAEESEPQDPELEQFRQFMAEAKYAAALEELRNIVPRRWGELELHRLVHRLAKLTGNQEVLLRHGEQYIGVLLEQNRVREAMEVYQDLVMVMVKPQFRPILADQHLPIAQMLRDSRLPREAIALINGFHKRFPHSEFTPALYLLAAKIFHDDLNDDAKASQILRFVAAQYPGHGLIGSVRHYLRVLEGPSGRGDEAPRPDGSVERY